MQFFQIPNQIIRYFYKYSPFTKLCDKIIWLGGNESVAFKFLCGCTQHA